MKVAKIINGDKWLVHDVERGWIATDGSIVQPQASQRHTKFFKGITEAKIEGFTASDAQAKVIAKWDSKPAPAAPAPTPTPTK